MIDWLEWCNVSRDWLIDWLIDWLWNGAMQIWLLNWTRECKSYDWLIDYGMSQCKSNDWTGSGNVSHMIDWLIDYGMLQCKSNDWTGPGNVSHMIDWLIMECRNANLMIELDQGIPSLTLGCQFWLTVTCSGSSLIWSPIGQYQITTYCVEELNAFIAP